LNITPVLPPISGFIPSSLIEWQGKIASVLFLPGCNLRCRYCHSADLVLHADKLPDIHWEEVRQSLDSRKDWLDGAEVTGGEPTLHPELPELLEALKRLGLAVKLDTNGTRPGVVEELIGRGLVDYVAMDLKAPLDERYHTLTATECELDALRDSVQLLLKTDTDHEFRTTVCPAFTDEEEMSAIAREIEGARRLVLQPFRPVGCLDPEMLGVTPYSPEKLQSLAELARPHVQECWVRGQEPLRAG